jgi:hypothetical protein
MDHILVICLSSGGDRSGPTESMRSQIAARGTRNETGAAEENLTTGDTQTCEFMILSAKFLLLNS